MYLFSHLRATPSALGATALKDIIDLNHASDALAVQLALIEYLEANKAACSVPYAASLKLFSRLQTGDVSWSADASSAVTCLMSKGSVTAPFVKNVNGKFQITRDGLCWMLNHMPETNKQYVKDALAYLEPWKKNCPGDLTFWSGKKASSSFIKLDLNDKDDAQNVLYAVANYVLANGGSGGYLNAANAVLQQLNEQNTAWSADAGTAWEFVKNKMKTADPSWLPQETAQDVSGVRQPTVEGLCWMLHHTPEKVITPVLNYIPPQDYASRYLQPWKDNCRTRKSPIGVSPELVPWQGKPATDNQDQTPPATKTASSGGGGGGAGVLLLVGLLAVGGIVLATSKK